MSAAPLDQAAARRQGIGASEGAAALGLDPYGSPVQLFALKLGLIEPEPPNDDTRIGQTIEPFLLEEYRRRLGGRFLMADEIAERYAGRCFPGIQEGQVTVRHVAHPWLFATPDRVLARNGDRLRGVEVKNRGRYTATEWGESGSQDVPHAALVQCLLGMECLGLDEWGLGAYFGGSDFRTYIIERDDEVLQALLEGLYEFWHEHVEKADAPPPIRGDERESRVLAAIFRKHDLTMVAPPEPTADLLVDYFALRARLKEAEGEEQLMKAQLQQAIGAHLGLELPDGRYVTWKKNKDGLAVEWEAVARELADRFKFLAKGQLNEEVDRLMLETVAGNTAPKIGPRVFRMQAEPKKGGAK